jgi:hypothetical protein
MTVDMCGILTEPRGRRHQRAPGCARRGLVVSSKSMHDRPDAGELEALVLGRRPLLRLMGLGAVAGILPGGCTGVPTGFEPSTTLRILSPRTYAVFTAAAMRMVGPRGAALIADRTVDVGKLADAWLERAPELAGQVGQALLLLEFGCWPLMGKLRPFTSLDPAAQDAILTECMSSRLETKRAVFRGIRSLAMLTFYGSPATRTLASYPGPFGTGDVTIADAMRD